MSELKREVFNTGFISEVYAEGDRIVKKFGSIPTVFVPLERRFQQEVKALTKFGGRIAPEILSVNYRAYEIEMMRLPGENARLVVENGTTEYQERHIYSDLGSFLHQIHKEPVEGCVSPKEYTLFMKDKAEGDLKIFLNSGLPHFLNFPINDLAVYLVLDVLPEINRLAGRRTRLSYTHGDFWTNNAIAQTSNDGASISGIIDWEFSRIGFPEEDLAQLFMWEFWKRPETKKYFEEGYGTIKEDEILPFIVLKLLDYMEGASLKEWNRETELGDSDFLHVHVKLLQSLLEKSGNG